MRILTNALNKILAGCCCIILAIMVACVSWQVAARFIFNAPSSTLDEFTQILFMWMILLGGVYTAGLKKTFSYRFVSAKTLPNARPRARQYHSGDYYRVRADFYGVRR